MICYFCSIITIVYFLLQIENVMRHDLALKFHQAVKEANHNLWRRARDHPHFYNLNMEIAFHGTRTQSLPSIGEGQWVDPLLVVSADLYAQNVQLTKHSSIVFTHHFSESLLHFHVCA